MPDDKKNQIPEILRPFIGGNPLQAMQDARARVKAEQEALAAVRSTKKVG